jgi:lipid A ethanolaminephosphotransferase
MALIERLRFQTTHARFAVIFPLLLYAICNALNFDKLSRWFVQNDGLDYPALSAYLIAGLCLFIVFFTLAAHRWTLKPMAILLVICSAAATYFISKYDVAVDRSMILNTIHTDLTEVRQLLSPGMLPYVIFLLLLPVLIILLAEVSFQPSGKYLLRSLAIISVALVIAVASLYSNYNAIHRAGNVSKKYIVYSLVPINVLSGSLSAASRSIRPWLVSGAGSSEISGRVASRDNLVVVLAIGESSRRANFSLYGYRRRNTNPVLAQTRDLHLLNGIARRGSTLLALPQILERADVKLPMMVSRLGIPTACLVHYTLYDNCESVGETMASQCGHGGKCYDEDVIPLLERNLGSYESGKRFIVLHLGGGSHGPVYRDRHPPEFRLLEPACNDADVANQCTVEEIYNSYDNTILYVDHVLGEILRKLDRSRVPYVFIYLSDHGESLMEGGRMFHGMPPGISLPPEQAQIPLIVKSSVPISIVKRAEYQQQDVFDTVLDLLSIETTMFDTSGSFITRPTRSIAVEALADFRAAGSAQRGQGR